jgi:hypothetical protein
MYEFRASNGRVCCQTDNPAHLCATCKLRARGRAGAPPPPDLAAFIKAKRAQRVTVAAARDLDRERVRQYFARAPRPLANGRVL